MVPDYYLTRPGSWTDADAAEFERLYDDQVRPGDGRAVEYDLATPRWQFLCWLTETHDVLLHGSGRGDIEEFELRHPTDKDPFADRPAVFAASDGLWAMFFALVDRDVAQSLINTSVVHVDGGESTHYYYFSLDAPSLAREPWRPGTVYALPRAGFEQQEGGEFSGHRIEFNQWVSLTPVRPLARVIVTPADFPFLDRVNGHDVEAVARRVAADPEGFPWQE